MKMQKFAGFLSAIMMMSSSVPAVVAAADDDKTILHNADFENGTDGWDSFGGTSVRTTNDEHHAGNYCLYVSDRRENWQGVSFSDETILTAGKTYQFSAWVQSVESDQIQMQISYVDSDGVSQRQEIGGTDSTKGEWSEIQAEFEIPADATNILLHFQTAEGTNDFMLDDILISGESDTQELF
ncbi:MAG: carbohydrate binding domain-containing protein [Oscillospiraceae bacterium]|nr:carbohydrate binding domain-containing protein [Oscillospiraceae bacterium]